MIFYLIIILTDICTFNIANPINQSNALQGWLGGGIKAADEPVRPCSLRFIGVSFENAPSRNFGAGRFQKAVRVRTQP